jgi:hypothetical protein
VYHRFRRSCALKNISFFFEYYKVEFIVSVGNAETFSMVEDVIKFRIMHRASEKKTRLSISYLV